MKTRKLCSYCESLVHFDRVFELPVVEEVFGMVDKDKEVLYSRFGSIEVFNVYGDGRSCPQCETIVSPLDLSLH
jgi:hypothetical protein